jgi:hypothetical protein
MSCRPSFATRPARSEHSLVTDRRSWSQEAIAYAVATASDAVSSNLLKRSQSKQPLSLAMQYASRSDSKRLAICLTRSSGRFCLVRERNSRAYRALSCYPGPMEYFTNACTRGRVRYRQLVASAIGILESAGDSTPIGMAFHVGRSTDGLALWRLKVRGTDVPGHWIIDDGQFVELGDSGGYQRDKPAEIAD